MPAKKVTRVQKKSSKFDIQNIIKNPDSYKSLIYGIVTVVVLFVVLFLGLRTLSKNQADITNNAVNTEQTGKVHTVLKNETLWNIAEIEYGDGFKWEIIANANNITDASSLEEGRRLNIPEMDIKISQINIKSKSISPSISPTKSNVVEASPKISPKPAVAINVNDKIAGTTYKVVEGDNLWNIAVRAYGDGYRWTEIARDNKLVNPDLIHPGNVFRLRRP